MYPYSLGIIPRFQTKPPNKTSTQLIMRKMNPIVIDGVSETSVYSAPVTAFNCVKPPPSPIRILNTGPAKHAVIAILASPFLAIVIFADKSPIELPHAKIVIPIIEPGIRQMTPSKVRSLTSKSAMVSIHVAAMIKPIKAIGT